MANEGNRTRILLVEDEPNLAFSLKLNLENEGYEVVLASTGGEAVKLFKERGPFVLLILDVMLPELDGFEVAHQVRAESATVGILMLTARASDEDRILGLRSGSDDYLTKPFHLEELLLRVKRMVTRHGLFQEGLKAQLGETLTWGSFSLDKESLVLTGPTGTHSLTALESEMLGEFIRNVGRVLTREQLLQRVWGLQGNLETRTVDNFVVRLRRYIEENPARPERLVSVRGRGYKLELPR